MDIEVCILKKYIIPYGYGIIFGNILYYHLHVDFCLLFIMAKLENLDTNY